MRLHELVDFIPYVGLVTRAADDMRGRPLLTRLVESSLPGIVVALIFMYSDGQVNKADITALKAQSHMLQQQQASIIQSLAEVKTELYLSRNSKQK